MTDIHGASAAHSIATEPLPLPMSHSTGIVGPGAGRARRPITAALTAGLVTIDCRWA